jgi:hypothetical protein
MKRFMFLLIAVLLLASAVNAAPASISLYIIDHGAMVNYMNRRLVESGPIETDTIGVYYMKGDGDELGKELNFNLLSSLSSPWELVRHHRWENKIQASDYHCDQEGNCGYILRAYECLGIGQEVVYLGDFYITWLLSPPETVDMPFNLQVVAGASDFALWHPHPAGLLISRCDPDDTWESVLGGTFYFNSEAVAVKPTTWGAIKSLYK